MHIPSKLFVYQFPPTYIMFCETRTSRFYLVKTISVLRARFKLMEEIHRAHSIELDSITQDDDGTLTQGTQGTTASRMSLSTIFTSTTSNTNAITQEDMEAFQRAVDAKQSELKEEHDDAKKHHRLEEDSMQKSILEFQAQKAAIENDRKRNESAKQTAARELTQISSQLLGALSRVRESDVEDAKESAANLAEKRDALNKHPRREDIAKEIRVLEDRLKSISATIEQDTKIRDQLVSPLLRIVSVCLQVLPFSTFARPNQRLRQEEQNEVSSQHWINMLPQFALGHCN